MLVISSLSAGGAQRVISEMANYWQAHGNTITMLTLDSDQSDYFPLNRCIQRITIGFRYKSGYLWNALWNNIKRIVLLRSAFKRSAPNVIISFIDTTNVLTIVAGMGLQIPIIVSERTDPRHHDIGVIWKRLRRMVYPKATAVVVQTPGVYDWLRNEMPYVNAINIPNPARSASKKQTNGFVFPEGNSVVAVGRLSREKGFDLAIKAFSQCAADFPRWNLIIFGEGDERIPLESLVAKHELSHRILLPGLIKEPMQSLPYADIFVLSSHFEGFPNALVEAMSCGLAVIATDCQSGPSELIRHSIDGILVPMDDVAALANALRDLMAHPEKREILALRAKEVVDRFSVERIMGMWEALL